MIGFLLYFAVAFLIGMTIQFISEGYFDEDSFYAGLAGMMVGIILYFVLWLASPITYDYEEREPINTIQVSALKDNNSSTSSFFLGSGNIGSSQYYFYMTDNAKGKRMGKISSSKPVYIKEVPNTKPRLEIYEAKHKYLFLEFILPDNTMADDEYIFYVPNGTITTEFDVDLD